MSANEPDLATIVSVPVEYNHFPKDLEISSDIVETIDLEARGPSGQLRKSGTIRDIAAIIDFASVNAPGERTFTLTNSGTETAARNRFDPDHTRAAPVHIRKARHSLSYRVEVPFSGKLPAGFSIASVDIEPPQLQIAGPESHVLRIGQAGFRSVRSDECQRMTSHRPWRYTPPNRKCGF